MLRLVLDTNTALSGLLWGGTPGRLIASARAGDIALFSSQALLAELQGVIEREKFAKELMARNVKAGDLMNGYAALCRRVQPAPIVRTSIDADDDVVLATASAARAHLIVSGDRKHLLILKTFEGIPIVTTAEVIAIVHAGWPGEEESRDTRARPHNYNLLASAASADFAFSKPHSLLKSFE